MSNMNITDDMLFQYVPIAEELLIERLPAERELNHVFSKGFERKMKKLIRQYKRSPFMNAFVTAAKRVAVVLFITILITLTTVVSVEAYRNRFFNIIKNIYKEFTSITFEVDDQPSDIQFESVKPQYIPEGFSKAEFEKTHTSECTIYSNKAGTDIIYQQDYITSDQIIIDTEGTEIMNITINGMEVEYIYNKDTYLFMWYQGNYAFSLISSIEKDELIKMIESMDE